MKRHAPATARNLEPLTEVLAEELPASGLVLEIASGSGEHAVLLDAAQADWPIAAADAALCVNMVHISPWDAAVGLFAGAGRILASGAPLVLYGPFIEPEQETAASNLAFDQSLKQRNPEWGLRDLTDLDALAADHGLRRTARHAMPANNLALVYRRG